MSRLTSMMQRAGLLTQDDVARVETYAQDNELAPVDAVLQLGLTDEDALVGFLQSKLMIPAVSAEILGRLEPETVSHLPGELAWYHGVIPVSVDEVGNLTLAMADPTDLRAVDAVAAHTAAYLVRAVAAASPLRTALGQHYGPRPRAYSGPATPRGMPAAEAAPAPVTTPLSRAALGRVMPRLLTSADRDEITEHLLEFLAAGFTQVIMFVHLRNQIRGRDARGPDLLLEAVTQVRIPTTGPSVFSDVIDRRAPYFGPWQTERQIDKAFAEGMGGIEGNVLVLPVRLRDKVPLVVFAAGSNFPVDPNTIEQLADGVSQALERLIYRRKSSPEIPQPQ